MDWSPSTPRNIRFLRAKVRVRISEPLLMGTMIGLDTGGFVWITIRYERIYKLCRNCGRIGHSYPHCPWTNEEISEAIDEQMNRLYEVNRAEMGMSFTRTHFVSEARRFLNNEERRSTFIRTFTTPTGRQYQPVAAPTIDYDFDPMGFLNEEGEMQSLSPETEDMIEQQAGHAVNIESEDDDILEPATVGIDNLGFDNDIDLHPPDDNPVIPEMPNAPTYQDPAIYPDELEDPEVLAHTWNWIDRRPPCSIYPFKIPPTMNLPCK